MRAGRGRGAGFEQAKESGHSEASREAQEDGREAPNDDPGEAPLSGRPPSLLAVVDDLFVRGRIDAAAEASGVEVRYVGSIDDVREATVAGLPRALLVGMAATRRPWADLVRSVKSDPALREIYVLAFGPHKNLELRAQALNAGADRVLANSAFARALPTLLATPEAAVSEEEDGP